MIVNNELMYPSIFWLHQRINKWFEENYQTRPSFPGYRCDLIWHDKKVRDVVLFGDAAYSLCLTQWWPRNSEYRLWVLNESLKAGLIKIFKFSDKEIGVLPREALLRRSHSPRNFPSKLGPVNFIFSARKMNVKHFDLSCYLTHFLQKNYFGKNLRLHLYAPRRNKAQLAFRVPKLDWEVYPKIMGDQGMDWIKTCPKNSFFLNLNVDPFDDFGVSCAQAQEKGFPLIISNRGPYKDLRNDSTIKVPVDLLKLKTRKNDLIKQAEDVGHFIMGEWFQKNDQDQSLKIFEFPKALSSKRIQNLKTHLTKNLKDDLKMYPDDESIWEKKLYLMTENLL